MMLKEIKLPEGLEKYQSTKVFNAETVPQGLLREHSTKAGTWGQLNVSGGTVTYNDQHSCEKRLLNAGDIQVIEPEAVHFIEPSAEAVFWVDFFRLPKS